jgi:hypothetical protein
MQPLAESMQSVLVCRSNSHCQWVFAANGPRLGPFKTSMQAVSCLGLVGAGNFPYVCIRFSPVEQVLSAACHCSACQLAKLIDISESVSDSMEVAAEAQP